MDDAHGLELEDGLHRLEPRRQHRPPARHTAEHSGRRSNSLRSGAAASSFSPLPRRRRRRRGAARRRLSGAAQAAARVGHCSGALRFDGDGRGPKTRSGSPHWDTPSTGEAGSATSTIRVAAQPRAGLPRARQRRSTGSEHGQKQRNRTPDFELALPSGDLTADAPRHDSRSRWPAPRRVGEPVAGRRRPAKATNW